ncbi:hypothetical protein SAMN06269185_3118 [Natronoarchaeum philippinense]|uniref:Uncharacterized protein n=1 Tax=Natronoarchaeum philippinense TaxID=558529 RepID=A0A285PD20_NATPI|nr:hypothetical protein [Natronoarchaeum philippinense]SNZ17751.1 hypothetical protein SAMN06269185_3118 [Natronoarchaeum philippinense]
METFEIEADETGTIELVCERTDAEAAQPRVRAFVGGGEFGVLVDDLAPGERVSLFVEDGAIEKEG